MKRLPASQIEQLTRGESGDPHSILGPHPEDDGVTFRIYKPLARTVTVVTSDGDSERGKAIVDRVLAGRTTEVEVVTVERERGASVTVESVVVEAEKAPEADADAQVYGCGCFQFVKPA